MNIVRGLVEFVMDILETVVFIGSLFIVVYLFLIVPNKVQGASMDNTFHSGDYILTSKISYKLNPPKRGDIVVFKSPKNPDIDYIKRIIGVSGDKVRIYNGDVFVNGQKLDEPYITAATTLMEGGFMQNGVEVTVPLGYLYVMGDNRPRSSDSREFGFVPIDDIIGKVFFRYFPPGVSGPIKNPYTSFRSPAIFLNTSDVFLRFPLNRSVNLPLT